MRIFIEFVKHILKGKILSSISMHRYLIFSFIIVILVNLLLSQFALLFAHDSFVNHRSQLEFGNTFKSGLIAIVIFPFVEESAFRLFLSKRRVHLLISLSLLYAMYLSVLLLALWGDQIDNHFLTFCCVSLILFAKAALFLIIPSLNGSSLLSRILKVLEHNFIVFYYISTILFGLIHILFQSLYMEFNWLVGIVFFISYSFTGLVLSNMRISLGFIYAVGFHALLNGLASL